MIVDIPTKTISAIDVVKRAMFLAYEGCGQSSGKGVLRRLNSATEDEVWGNVVTSGDYPGKSDNKINKNKGDVHADYVFGRMMKVRIRWIRNGVDVYDDKPRLDYQGWCNVYPTYLSLVEEAVKQLLEEEK